MDDEKDRLEEESEDEDTFPWEDIEACRRKKRSPEGGETAEEMRTQLRGTIEPCPKCGKSFDAMEVFYFRSPSWTWQHLCGRAGWMVICPDCKKQIWFGCEIMS